MQIVKLCYGSYAYVYLTDTSVYNVTLGNFSSTYSTPNFQRYVFTVPDSKYHLNIFISALVAVHCNSTLNFMIDEDNSKNGLQAIDYIIIAAVAVITLVSIVILVSTKMCRKVGLAVVMCSVWSSCIRVVTVLYVLYLIVFF